ncbi:solute carrier family 23 protein [Azospirillum agricola]|uniref:solute carrier family 23 protein n=1 Tax=Azospirillum agricola TaxID=1720247 RepID=UPI000A0EF322|nr:solute carrier family 23 protein [Azospirillum agricola]SMH58805.1 Xanthine/uracil permease [Azospirillum lipoferum]
MSDRPQNLLYALDERPPARVTAVLAMQHMVLGLMMIMYPVIMAAEIGLDGDATSAFVTTAILAVGLATILQATPVGSGFLAVALPNPVIMPVFIATARSGGLGAAAGTLAASAVLQLGLAKLLPRLRSYLPPEVCGVSVLMLGVSMVKGAGERAVGYQPGVGPGGDLVDARAMAVAGTTLAVIIGLSIWGKGRVRLYAMLAGCAAGYGLALWFGLIDAAALARVADAPLLALPVPAFPRLSVSLEALLPMVMIMLISVMDGVGCIITLDRMNRAHWSRTDMPKVSRGVFAEGLASLASGLSGGSSVGFSSANIGLEFASGVTARVVGLAAGAALMAAAFVPKITAALILMPGPVIGAVLIYTAACLITAGMDLIMSRMMNDRRVMVVGLSVILGVSVTALPGLYHGVPGWIAPIFHSEVTVAALAALLLNMLFRIGVRQRAAFDYDPRTMRSSEVHDFFERQGGVWGARREVVARAVLATLEAIDVLTREGLARETVRIDASFDELNLDVLLRYRGGALSVTDEAVDVADLLDVDDETLDRHMRGIAGRLIKRAADRVVASARGENSQLLLHFAH